MKRSFTTQMDAAKKGILTPEMENVLRNESISGEDLFNGISSGIIAIPANRHHTSLKASGIGKGLKTKINVNLGVSRDVCSFESEMNKARLAVDLKADALMDLSVSGDTEAFRKRLVSEIPILTGSCPFARPMMCASAWATVFDREPLRMPQMPPRSRNSSLWES